MPKLICHIINIKPESSDPVLMAVSPKDNMMITPRQVFPPELEEEAKQLESNTGTRVVGILTELEI